MSKKIEKSICPICGKKFVKKVNNQVYCCIKCKKVAKKNAAKAKKAKKPVAKKIVEKIKLPKPINKAIPSTAVIIKGNDPFKIFAIATLIREKALRDIASKVKFFGNEKCKKTK